MDIGATNEEHEGGRGEAPAVPELSQQPGICRSSHQTKAPDKLNRYTSTEGHEDTFARAGYAPITGIESTNIAARRPGGIGYMPADQLT